MKVVRMPFKKFNPNKPELFTYVTPIGQGQQGGFLAKKEGKDTYYVIKEAGSKVVNDYTFDDIEILNKLADQGEDLELLSDDNFMQRAKELTDHYDKQKYFSLKEMFCGQLIHLIAPQCTPKHRVFEHVVTRNLLFTFPSNGNAVSNQNTNTNDNTPALPEPKTSNYTIGCKFMHNYKDWSEAYDHKKNKINHCPLTPTGEVKTRTGNKPVLDLGTITLLRWLLGTEDMHDDNFGVIRKDNHYQMIILDYGTCLDNFNFLTGEEQDEVESTYIIDPKNILAIFDQIYILNNYEVIPTELRESPRVKAEIFATIDKLNTNIPQIEQLADEIFKEYPVHKELIVQNIKAGIKYLSKIAKQAQSLMDDSANSQSLADNDNFLFNQGNNTNNNNNNNNNNKRISVEPQKSSKKQESNEQKRMRQ